MYLLYFFSLIISDFYSFLKMYFTILFLIKFGSHQPPSCSCYKYIAFLYVIDSVTHFMQLFLYLNIRLEVNFHVHFHLE